NGHSPSGVRLLRSAPAPRPAGRRHRATRKEWPRGSDHPSTPLPPLRRPHPVFDSASSPEGTPSTVRLPSKHFGGILGDLRQGEAMTHDRTHEYRTAIQWTGNLGTGTAAYAAYGRDYRISIAGKPD